MNHPADRISLPLVFLATLACLAAAAAPAAASPLITHSQIQNPSGAICILSGDTHSPAAAGAVRELLASPDFAGIQLSVVPDLGATEADLARIAAADIVIAYARGRDRIAAIAGELAAVTARGGAVYVVGPSIQDDFDGLKLTRDREISAYFAAGGRANMIQMIRAAAARKLAPGIIVEPPVPIPDYGYYDVARARVVTDYDEYRRAYLMERGPPANQPANELSALPTTTSSSAAADPARASRPWVGLMLPRSYVESGATATIEAVAAALEQRGLNVLAGFSASDNKPLRALFLDAGGAPRVEALASLTLKMGFSPQKVGPALAEIGAPVLNGISLGSQSRDDWEASPAGIAVPERWWQLSGPELAGAVAPTVIAAKERVEDAAIGSAYVVHAPIAERVGQFAERVARWVRLRRAAPADRRVAVIYYNYTPGKAGIGASYLNVLPQSLWHILARLRADGYDTAGAPAAPAALFDDILAFGANARPDDADDMERLVRGGRAVLWPVAEYRKLFDRLPEKLRAPVLKKWGEPETSRTMVWRDGAGAPFFVFPTHRWGNIVFAPQPVRGWGEDPTASYHDLQLPAHHQYLAFYLWLQTRFDADAIVHVGRHATHEWMPGKEAGFTPADPGEALVAAIPQLYLYIVDGIGEGLQAKRRGMATIITHMTPPLDRASLSPELRELKGRINDYRVALEKGSIASGDTLREIVANARKMGLLLDLGITPATDGPPLTHEQIDEIEEHIAGIGDRLTPFGLHTFGVSPGENARRSTAEAILEAETGVAATPPSEVSHPRKNTAATRERGRPARPPANEPPALPTPAADRARRLADLMARIEASGPAELDALSTGLSGRYIAAGPGNDPVRQPDSLPTGKNFYGFDPTRLPTRASYETGARLAAELLENHRARHDGEYPDRLTFNLWSGETNRHEGVMEAQIFALLGVRPVWNRYGRVESVELIPREKLGRPRVDVTIAPSGLYRDAFPVLMHLIDEAVTLAKKSPEPDNPIARNTAAARAELIARGVPAAEAERLATVRLFTVPVGAYGAGIEKIITDDKGWNDESQVADVFMHRMAHLFGQGFWGEPPAAAAQDPELAKHVFRLALKGSKGVIHSRSGAVYASLDIDDFYQYLGGAALAIRQLDGQTPDVLVTDMSNPRAAETVTLERFMGKELRARYLNPKWVDAMLDEGYAGARFIMRMTDNLWGWQVTVPEAVGNEKWQELFEVYVRDKYDLDVRARFETAGNLRAYRSMVDRMLVAVDKGYWTAAPETVAELRAASAKAAQQIAAEEKAEMETLRARAPLPEFAPAPAAPAPTAAAPTAPPATTTTPATAPAPTPATAPTPALPAPVPAPAPDAPAAAPAAPAPAAAPPDATRQVEGKALEEVPPPRPPAAAAPIPMRVTLGIAAALALVALGWFRQARRP
ncbi:MAG: cobaltochelatase subunit CobN [Opitutaceae bacterium]|jgi:cobaltochelatase CobN|nr:cobaltochelatase subunit CobN [Opitutaceae bacterium]